MPTDRLTIRLSGIDVPDSPRFPATIRGAHLRWLDLYDSECAAFDYDQQRSKLLRSLITRQRPVAGRLVARAVRKAWDSGAIEFTTAPAPMPIPRHVWKIALAAASVCVGIGVLIALILVMRHGLTAWFWLRYVCIATGVCLNVVLLAAAALALSGGYEKTPVRCTRGGFGRHNGSSSTVKWNEVVSVRPELVGFLVEFHGGARLRIPRNAATVALVDQVLHEQPEIRVVRDSSWGHIARASIWFFVGGVIVLLLQLWMRSTGVAPPGQTLTSVVLVAVLFAFGMPMILAGVAWFGRCKIKSRTQGTSHS